MRSPLERIETELDGIIFGSFTDGTLGGRINTRHRAWLRDSLKDAILWAAEESKPSRDDSEDQPRAGSYNCALSDYHSALLELAEKI